MLTEQLHPKWLELLSPQLSFLQGIETRISAGAKTVPAANNILRALSWPPDEQRVLLLGQDPYPKVGLAVGLCFAVPEGAEPIPGSLRNILIELESDLGLRSPPNPNIERWAEAGVLMLNRHLTSAPGEVAAHLNWGWQQFTDSVIASWIEYRKSRAVAILWGKQARSVRFLLGDTPTIESAHPSPLSARRGFFGSRPFSRCNSELAKLQLTAIDWD